MDKFRCPQISSPMYLFGGWSWREGMGNDGPDGGRPGLPSPTSVPAGQTHYHTWCVHSWSYTWCSLWQTYADHPHASCPMSLADRSRSSRGRPAESKWMWFGFNSMCMLPCRNNVGTRLLTIGRLVGFCCRLQQAAILPETVPMLHTSHLEPKY